MNMFQPLLNSIPKNRLEMVEDLEIPEITLAPYIWTEPDDYISPSLRSESFLSDSMGDWERGTLSTDSSIPLSRAMTDSDIDYGFYKRYHRRAFSDPVDHMRVAMDAFPPDYFTSLSRFISTDPVQEIDDTYAAELAASRRRFNEELRRNSKRFLDKECCVYAPDDPGLLDLQDALRSLDMKVLDSEYLYNDWHWKRNWPLYDRALNTYPYEPLTSLRRFPSYNRFYRRTWKSTWPLYDRYLNTYNYQYEPLNSLRRYPAYNRYYNRYYSTY